MSYEARGPVGLIALWKRWYRGDGVLTDDSAMFAAALAALNLMGATLSVLWLVLPHPGHANELTIVGATLAAYALGTVLVLGQRAKPWWMFQLSIALDTLVISIALIATGDPGSQYAFYYLWATLYAVCFFSARMIAIQAAWVCVAYAGSLAVIGSERSWSRSGSCRARFGRQLEDALADRDEGPIAVAFVDLDHFKRVQRQPRACGRRRAARRRRRAPARAHGAIDAARPVRRRRVPGAVPRPRLGGRGAPLTRGVRPAVPRRGL
jgi:hypothetical protein